MEDAAVARARSASDAPRLSGPAPAAPAAPRAPGALGHDAPGHDGPPPGGLPNESAPASVLARDLVENAGAYDFFQAVRLLERLRPERAPVGGYGDPAAEAVRFVGNPTLAFPASEVEHVEWRDDAPAEMGVNFGGLVGSAGMLPAVYTSMIAQRLRAKDRALADFLDIFLHRVVSLFYRAWEKSRPAPTHGRGRRDRFTRHLLDLVGLGTAGLQERLPVPEESLLFYAGLLRLPTRPAAGLEGMIADYFGVPARVESFVGAWYTLTPGTQSRLGEEDDPADRLGFGAVAGDEVWDEQSRIRVRLGPLSRADFDRFLPGGEAHEALRALVRFYTGDELDAEAQLVLARDDVPPIVLGADDAPPLGWTTWFRSRPFQRDADETVLSL